MIDFKSLVGSTKDVSTYDLEKLYTSLDVKKTHTEPRPAQREAMRELTTRANEKDIVLKISTGAGKTAVGILYLFGHMKRQRRPAVYLCPTVQLVEQVLDEAARLGIRASHYARGEPYPDPAAARGDAVLVCTYEKLFNARSTFIRSDVNLMPCALVLDDAHAGAENVRKQFTLVVREQALIELLKILKPQCKAYHPTKWTDIEAADPAALLEVPHWVWTDQAQKIRESLHKYADTDDFRFVWPFLNDILPLCRCVISGTRAEIAPEVLPTHLVRPFQQAPHRLFMSATLADDSLLTRELGASPHSAAHPILPPSDRGLGERMIIAPSLVDPNLERADIMRLCVDLAISSNVVVLTSSEHLAGGWRAIGAKYFAADSFSEGVRMLRDPKSNLHFAVFAQRYDGVDLPDDACRVLVLDGIPYGESLIDRADSRMAFTPGGVRNRTIFRIEQGMGRAVRSHADFAVILLVGQDLASYIGRHDVLQSMTADTRNQIELSVELAELVRKSMSGQPLAAVRQVIDQCLNRDDGWKEFYNKRVRDAARPSVAVNQMRIALAGEERDAHVLAMSNNAIEAKKRLEKAIDASQLEGDELGIFLQRLSRIAYISDPPDGLRIQQGARERCYTVALPPEAPRRPSVPGAKTTAEKFRVWFKKFASPNAVVLEAKRIADGLDFSRAPHELEAMIMRLGEALGADSTRPEQDYGGEGPDNLWFWGGKAFVIEVKNRNTSSLHKADSGQLHNSLEWARTNYPAFADRLIPMTVANVTRADKDAHYPADTRVLTGDGSRELAQRLVQFCQKLSQQGPVFVTPENILAEMGPFGLLPEQFIGRYTKELA